MKKTMTTRVAVASSLALGVAVALGAPAMAKEGGAQSTHGHCSDTSTYKVAANGHKDSIRVKAQLKTPTAGDDWSYTVNDNGTQQAAGDATTAKNGKLKLKVMIPNADGVDTIDFAATDTVSGETCSAEVVYSG